VVEGDLDEVVAQKVLSHKRIGLGNVFGKKGKDFIMGNLRKFGQAAQNSPCPWLILVDLDTDEQCVPPFIKKRLNFPVRGIIFRVAVRKIESWLLADREAIASYLEIPAEKIPFKSEDLADPKQTVVNLARHSRNKGIREDMVPRPDSGAKQGPLYNSRMKDFVGNFWRVDIAAQNSDSLSRFIRALEKIDSPRKKNAKRTN